MEAIVAGAQFRPEPAAGDRQLVRWGIELALPIRNRSMSAFQKAFLALIALISCVIGAPFFMITNDPSSGLVVVPAIVGSVGYAVWFFTFKCPRCREPLLWTPEKSAVRGRLLPKRQCVKCGLSSHEVFVKTD